MRRIIGTIVFILIVLTPSIAFAHPSVNPVIVPINKRDSITFTVFGDESPTPLVGVDVEVPTNFEYQITDLPTQWNATFANNTVSISGGEIATSSESLNFTIEGKPTSLGQIKFPLTVIHQNGNRILWNDTSARPAPRVQVVKHVDMSDSKPTPVWIYFIPTIAGVVLVGGFFLYKARKT